MESRDEVIAFCCDGHFHQSLLVPGSNGDKPRRVTYGTTTNFEDTQLPAVLCCGPMGISRMLLCYLNHSALQAGVRILFVDRPGFGGTPAVPLEERIDTALQHIEAVCAKLQLSHLHLISHSAGTIYLQNVLERLPHLLHPDKPVAVAFGPWVHPKYSGSKVWAAAETLPQSWIGSVGTFNQIFGSTIGFSAGVFDSLGNFRSDAAKRTADEECRETHGMSKAAFKIFEETLQRYLRAEPCGIGEDAILCLKKNNLSWKACEELPPFIAKVAAAHAERAKEAASPSDARLVFRAVFAGEDVMTGKGGQDYYHKCWSDPSLASGIVFDSVKVPGSNHDNVMLPALGQIQEELGLIKRHVSGG